MFQYIWKVLLQARYIKKIMYAIFEFELIISAIIFLSSSCRMNLIPTLLSLIYGKILPFCALFLACMTSILLISSPQIPCGPS